MTSHPTTRSLVWDLAPWVSGGAVVFFGLSILRLMMGSLDTAVLDAVCLAAALSSFWESALAQQFWGVAEPVFRWGAILLLSVPFPVFILEFLEELVAEILELFCSIPTPSLPFVPDKAIRVFKSTLRYIFSGIGEILGFLVFVAIFVVVVLGFDQIFIYAPRFGLSAIRCILRMSTHKPKLVPKVNGVHRSKLKPYKYGSLEGGRDIRLLILNPGRDVDEISCCLSSVCLDKAPKYDALSYVWGDSTNSRTILCTDGMVQITFNLYSALWHLRYRDRQRVLWADALCINQQDLEERTQQVRMMADIYSYANQALIWLGEELEPARGTFEKIAHTASFFPSPETAWGYLDEAVPKQSIMSESFLQDSVRLRIQGEMNILDFSDEPLSNLLRSPYFHRKWVVQEIARSDKALMVWGDKELRWESMAGLVTHMWLRGFFNLMPSFVIKDRRITPFSFIGDSLMNVMCIDMIRRGSATEILTVLYATRRFQCSNPSDHVIAILGLTSDIDPGDLDVFADYTVAPWEIYKRLTVWSITKKESLLLLSFCSNPDIASANTLPSWIPDFSRLDPGPILPSYAQSVFAAAGDSHISARFSNGDSVLHVKGKAIDSIHALAQNVLKVTPNAPKNRTHTNEEDAEGEFHALRFQAWIKECRDFAFDNENAMPPKRFEAYWKTLTCDLTSTYQRTPPDFADLVTRYIELALKGFTDDVQPEAAADMVEAEQCLSVFSMRRRFCTTVHGRFGLVPLGAEAGDVMCIFYGGKVPYLIRPKENGQFVFIGHCYVHGFMDGEALEMGDIETQEFALC